MVHFANIDDFLEISKQSAEKLLLMLNKSLVEKVAIK